MHDRFMNSSLWSILSLLSLKRSAMQSGQLMGISFVSSDRACQGGTARRTAMAGAGQGSKNAEREREHSSKGKKIADGGGSSSRQAAGAGDVVISTKGELAYDPAKLQWRCNAILYLLVVLFIKHMILYCSMLFLTDS